MGMNYFTKRQTQTLDKLILVLAIIYTHHILFSPFPDIPLHIFLHYLCCYIVVQLKIQHFTIYNSVFKFNFFLIFLLCPLMKEQQKLTENPPLTSLV